MNNYLGFRRSVLVGTAFAIASSLSGAHAAPVGLTGDVTSNVIFGSGNTNGSFTGVRTDGGIELGLRAKQRFPPANTFNYDGDRTYTFDSTVPTTAPENRSIWNFEWSINTDWDSINNPSGLNINAYDYLLSVDQDPGAGATFLSFDPYAATAPMDPPPDHSFGKNFTGQGEGLEAIDDDNFEFLKNNNNLSQQSWNLGFNLIPFALIHSPGTFTIQLDALDKITKESLASTSIDVRVNPVPLPAALPLFGMGLVGMGLIGWRRKRKTAAIG